MSKHYIESQLSDFLVIQNKLTFFEVCRDLKKYVDNGLLQQESGNCTLDQILRLEGKNTPESQLIDFVDIYFRTLPNNVRYHLQSSDRGATFRRCDGTSKD